MKTCTSDLPCSPCAAVSNRAWQFLRVRKRFWLLPMVFVFALFAILALISNGSEANFIYTLN